MSREQLVDKLYFRAIDFFNASFNAEYEEQYLEIGRAYTKLAERVRRNDVNLDLLREKVVKLEKYYSSICSRKKDF